MSLLNILSLCLRCLNNPLRDKHGHCHTILGAILFASYIIADGFARYSGPYEKDNSVNIANDALAILSNVSKENKHRVVEDWYAVNPQETSIIQENVHTLAEALAIGVINSDNQRYGVDEVIFHKPLAGSSSSKMYHYGIKVDSRLIRLESRADGTGKVMAQPFFESHSVTTRSVGYEKYSPELVGVIGISASIRLNNIQPNTPLQHSEPTRNFTGIAPRSARYSCQ
jgi:hypothetical protein